MPRYESCAALSGSGWGAPCLADPRRRSVLALHSGEGVGFSVENDEGDHVLVSAPDMSEWLGQRDSIWTQRLKSIVQKL